MTQRLVEVETMPDPPLHCFHDRALAMSEGTIHYRQCCNCDRTPDQCVDTTCDGQRWATWAKAADDHCCQRCRGDLAPSDVRAAS